MQNPWSPEKQCHICGPGTLSMARVGVWCGVVWCNVVECGWGGDKNGRWGVKEELSHEGPSAL